MSQGLYQVGLLWSYDEAWVPDHYVMAKNWPDSWGKHLKANPKVRGSTIRKCKAFLTMPDPCQLETFVFLTTT